MTETNREPPYLRKHETYKQDHWRVVDVEGVDKVFATGLKGDPDIRVDIDGTGAKSMLSDYDGENINTSHWLSVERAKELRDQLDDAIEAAED